MAKQIEAALFALTVSVLLLAGCATKAKPAEPAGFIPMEQLEKQEAFPFHKIWLDPDVDWNRYTEIQFEKVRTEYLAEMDWWKALERGKAFERDAEKLAVYTKEIFERAFRDDPHQRFQVVKEPGPHTLVAEIALVEVIPSKVLLNTLGYTPFIGSAFKLLRTTKGRSTVAFEARVLEGETGRVVGLFADRESEKQTPFNVKDVTWYGHAQSIIAEWAYQSVKLANKEEGEIVQDSKPFHLKPW